MTANFIRPSFMERDAHYLRGRITMSQKKDEAKARKEVEEPTKLPFWQALLEEPFLLLALGLGVPMLFYIVWGILDLASVPAFSP